MLPKIFPHHTSRRSRRTTTTWWLCISVRLCFGGDAFVFVCIWNFCCNKRAYLRVCYCVLLVCFSSFVLTQTVKILRSGERGCISVQHIYMHTDTARSIENSKTMNFLQLHLVNSFSLLGLCVRGLVYLGVCVCVCCFFKRSKQKM